MMKETEEEKKFMREEAIKRFMDFSQIQDLPDSKESMEKIFDFVITNMRGNLIRDGELLAGCFIIMRNYIKSGYEVIVYPMPIYKHGDTRMHSILIKMIIEKIQDQGETDRKIVSVITVSEGHMSILDKKENMDNMGNLKNFISPREDPNAKEVLLFDIEQEFYKRTITYETVRSDNGDVVISEEPLVDHIKTYDETEAKVSNLGWFFTKGQGQN